MQPDGTVEMPPALPERRVMAPEAARTMIEIMRGVTEAGGTAKQAAIDGYAVAGKTGTAQKAANGHYDPGKYIASFVGVVPADDPRLAIIVVLDEPQGGHLGGAVAAPIFKEIAEEALRYLHVPPSAPDAGQGGAARGWTKRRKPPGGGSSRRATPPTSAVEPPRAAATDLPPDDEALGDDPALAETWDEVAGAEGRGATARPRPVTVPDFVGMSLGQAIHAARKSGVELVFDDPEGRATGVALRQRPAPGPAPRGRGLSRGVRAEGMNAPAADARRAAARESTGARARGRPRGRSRSAEVRDDSRLVGPGRSVRRGARREGGRAAIPRGRGGARRGGRSSSRASHPPSCRRFAA